MKIFKILLVAAGALAASASAASAVTTYATEVDGLHFGTGGGTDSTRDNPAFALGQTDSNFLSLGLGGIGVFSFGGSFIEPGTIVEVTNGSPEFVASYPESAELYVGTSFIDPTDPNNLTVAYLESQNFQDIGSVTNTEAQDPGFSFNFDGTYNFLAVVDTTGPGGPSTDGFDINSIAIDVVPLPASVVLFGSGLAALGFLGWRKRRQSVAAFA